MGRDRLRIVMLGMMGRLPWAGQAYIYLHWLRGFQKLGHDVWYVEDESVWPYDPIRAIRTDDCSHALEHIRTVLDGIGLGDRWAYRLADREGAIWGLTEPELRDLYASCDVLVNLQGATDLRDEHMAAPFRVYVQTDPVGAEIKLAQGDDSVRSMFDNHDVTVTYGENYGAPDSDVPLNGIKYIKSRQPVDLDLWPMTYDPDARYFTTIGNYRQPGRDIEWNGDVYRWSKHYEWERFIDVPSRTDQEFELALNGYEEDDRAYLESHGWQVTPCAQMSLDVYGAYRDYIQASRGHFSVAKDQNVRLRSGWFSDRDVTYLASGKPVVSQDTGFSNVLPTGEGLFGFLTPDEAVAAVEEVNSDYERHARAARAIAEEHFEASRVVGKLLADLGLD